MKTRLCPTDQVKGNSRCFKMKNALLYLNQDSVWGFNLYKRSPGTKSFEVRELTTETPFIFSVE